MNEVDDQVTLARAWLDKATADLAAASHLLAIPESAPLDTVCFHAQQSVEKSVRALLTNLGVGFPKTHDVGQLVPLLQGTVSLPLTAGECELLSDYAVQTRYPGPWESPTREEADAAVEVAKRVLQAASARLGEQRGGSPSSSLTGNAARDSK